MIAHADAQKPPTLVYQRPLVKARNVWVFKGSSVNGYVRIKIRCSAPSCGPTRWDDLNGSLIGGSRLR